MEAVPEAGESKDGPSPEPSGGAGPAHPLPDLGPLASRTVSSEAVVFSHPALCFVMQSEKLTQ